MAQPPLGEFIIKNINPEIKPMLDFLLQDQTVEKAKLCNKIVVSLATIDDKKLLSIIVKWKRARNSNLPKGVEEQTLELLVSHYRQHIDEPEENRSIPLVTLYKTLPFENHVIRQTVKRLREQGSVKAMIGGRWMAILEPTVSLCTIK